jgi:hypothetical protein
LREFLELMVRRLQDPEADSLPARPSAPRLSDIRRHSPHRTELLG